MSFRRTLVAALMLAPAAPATAILPVDASVSVTTDERRRGISWSDGKASAAAELGARLPGGFDLSARATATRGDPRSGGADAVFDLTGGYRADIVAGLKIDAFLTGHVFAGTAGGMNYAEAGLGASYAIGPAEIGVDARYAPSQSAIGGDNLYLGAHARVGIPATPWTLAATVGHSSGSTDDPVRAARLRPGGDYSDWSLGVDHVTGPLAIGVAYSGTDIAKRADASPFAVSRHAGDKLVGKVSLSF